MNLNDVEIWKGKNLSQLLKNIYDNQRSKQSQIDILIDTLKPLIKTSEDAAIIVPLIKDYLDVSVKNDSHLVRLAGIVQRIIAAEQLASSSSAAGILSEEEKQQLIREADKELQEITNESNILKKETEALSNATKQAKELVIKKSSTETGDGEEEDLDEQDNEI